MNLVDVHAHLDTEVFKDDMDDVIKRAEDNGIKAIISNGINPESNRISLELADKYEIVKAALGIYPIDALAQEAETGEYSGKIKPFDVDEEIKFIQENKDRIIAVGEIGLDFKQSQEKDRQKEIFTKLLTLAKQLNKPVIVHSRKAELDVIELLEQHKMKDVVLHCFTGKLKLVKRAVENGWYFSIPPIVMRSQQFQLISELVPLRQTLTETDAPGLSPYPGKRNEPAFVVETIKKLAEIHEISQEEVSEQIFANYKKLFKP